MTKLKMEKDQMNLTESEIVSFFSSDWLSSSKTFKSISIGKEIDDNDLIHSLYIECE